jgi:hypothetical protein
VVAWLEPPLLEPTRELELLELVELELFVFDCWLARLCLVGLAGVRVDVPAPLEVFWWVVVVALVAPLAEAAPSATAVPRAPAAPSATMPCWVRRLRRIFFSRLLVMTTRVRRKYVWFL